MPHVSNNYDLNNKTHYKGCSEYTTVDQHNNTFDVHKMYKPDLSGDFIIVENYATHTELVEQGYIHQKDFDAATTSADGDGAGAATAALEAITPKEAAVAAPAAPLVVSTAQLLLGNRDGNNESIEYCVVDQF